MRLHIICYSILCFFIILTISSCSESDAADGTVDPAIIEATIQQYFQYVNNEQLDELMTLFDVNTVFNAPFGFNDVTDHNNIRLFYTVVFSNSPYHLDSPQEIFIKGNHAAILINAYSGESEATATLIKAMDHMGFNSEGKISSFHAYLDSAPLLCPDAIPTLPTL